jgi:hypothetical protein
MAMQQNTGVSHVSRRRYWREADARLVVEAWRQSGLSMARYGAYSFRESFRRIPDEDVLPIDSVQSFTTDERADHRLAPGGS